MKQSSIRNLLSILVVACAAILLLCPQVPLVQAASVFSWHSVYGFTQDFRDVWLDSPSDAFIVGEGVILHFDGDGFTPMLSDPAYSLAAVWGTSGSNVFAVGAQGRILHYDGTSWQLMNSPVSVDLTDIWGTSANDVFAVGHGRVVHYDGTAWSSTSVNATFGLQSVWGNSPSNYFAVGTDTALDKGLILHFDGSAWQTVSDGAWPNLFGVWGSGPTDIYAVGHVGTILHCDGISWSEMAQLGIWLSGVWGTSSSDVYAVDQGIVHFDGSSWNPVPGSATLAFTRISGSSDGHMMAVGSSGSVAYFGDKQFPVFSITPLRDQWNKVTDFDAPVGGGVMHTAFRFQVDPLVSPNRTDITLTHTNPAFSVYQLISPATAGEPLFTFSPTQTGLVIDTLTISCAYGSSTFQLIGNGVGVENPDSWFSVLPANTKAERLVLDDTRDCLYITDAGNNRIIVFSLSQRQVVATIPVGQQPEDCALDQDRMHLYVTNAGDSTISDVDLAAMSEVHRYLVPSVGPTGTEAGYVPYSITMIGNTVALIGSRPPGLASGGPLYLIDFSTLTLTVRRDLGSGRYSVVRTSDDFSTVVALPEVAGSPACIVRYEPATGSVAASSFLRIEREIVVNDDGTAVVTTNNDNNVIIPNLRVTDHDLNFLTTIDLISGQSLETVFHPGGNYIYSLSDALVAIEEASLDSKTETRELRFAPQDHTASDRPKTSVVSPDGTWLYALLVKTWNEPPSELMAIKVNRGLVDIGLSPSSVSANVGESVQFSAVGTYVDGSTANITRAVTWSSDNPASALIGSHTGLAQLIDGGSVNITASLGGITRTATMNIPQPQRIVFTTTPRVLVAGMASDPMTVQTRDSDNTTLNVDFDTALSLTASSTTGLFATDPDFAPGHIVTSVTVPRHANSATFYYKDTKAGNPTITASASGFAAAAQRQTVVPAAAAQVLVETAADGGGVLVPPQTIVSGSALTVFAVTRDSFSNYVANSPAAWSLVAKTGGVEDGSLAPSGDNKSATFTAQLAGTVRIKATVLGASSVDSGVLTISAGQVDHLSIIVQPASGLSVDYPLGTSAIVAASDGAGNPIAGVAIAADSDPATGTGTIRGTLSVTTNATGQAVFTSLAYDKIDAFKVRFVAAGKMAISAMVGPLAPGTPTKITVETRSDGGGNVVPGQTLNTGSTLTVFGVTRDQFGNFTGNPTDTTWSLTNKTGGLTDADLSAASGSNVVLTGHAAGSAVIHAANGSLLPVESGVITFAAQSPGGPGGGGLGGGGSGGGPTGPGVTTLTIYTNDEGLFNLAATANSDDGKVVLTFAKGVLGRTKDNLPLKSVKIAPYENPPAAPTGSNLIGLAYEITPEGATFVPGITLSLAFEATKLPANTDVDNLALATWNATASKWDLLKSTVNKTDGTVSTSISHLSVFAVIGNVIVPPPPSPPPAPARFTVSDISVTPQTIMVGQSVTVSVKVSNGGGVSGECEVTLKVNGVATGTKKVTVGAGGAETLSFAAIGSTAGNYAVDVNGVTASFAVEQQEPTATTVPSQTTLTGRAPPARDRAVVLTVAVVVGALLIGGGVLLISVRRRGPRK